MITIQKKFIGYPFAHRQHTHDGHCSMIHGHNWDFEILLGAEELDENGFIFDFGKMGLLKKWLEDTFDHTLLLNEDDEILLDAESVYYVKMFSDIKIVESCSCEGIAKMIWDFVNNFIQSETGGRVECLSVTVYEDHKNSATYHNSDLEVTS